MAWVLGVSFGYEVLCVLRNAEGVAMTIQTTEVVIVGAGQSGLALSAQLSERGIEHLVLERDRIAERWRTCRWDSLVANGPAWHDRFPTMEFEDYNRDAFVPREGVVAYFESFARRIKAPIKCGVEVTRVSRRSGAAGFTVETSAGTWRARVVVAATGSFQEPVIPRVVPTAAKVFQLHSSGYKNPRQLPDGAVLVVGAGSSGAQIAQELMESGRTVYLSVSAHDRLPRRYRGRDNVWWLGVLGLWEMPTPRPGTKHVTIAVSGVDGGKTIDYRRFGHLGMTLVGRTDSYKDGKIYFADDLQENIAYGDKNYFDLLDAADLYISDHGLDLPEEPEAREILPDPECVKNPLRELDLAAADVQSIIWATGYGFDFGWLEGKGLDAAGNPAHTRGISTESGLYFVGLPWQSRRGSSFIWGVWQDAKFIADQIAIQRDYLTYSPTA